MLKMPWPPSLRGVLLNDDDSFTTFSRFFFFFSINFWGLFQLGSLKTANASKFPGIEFLGAEPRVRRRNKNSTILSTSSLKPPVRKFHVSILRFSLPLPSSLQKLSFDFTEEDWGESKYQPLE